MNGKEMVGPARWLLLAWGAEALTLGDAVRSDAPPCLGMMISTQYQGCAV
jgi:hypothetical protein